MGFELLYIFIATCREEIPAEYFDCELTLYASDGQREVDTKEVYVISLQHRNEKKTATLANRHF